MTTKQQTDNQGINPDIIPNSIKDVISERTLKSIERAIKGQKIILHSLKDKKQQKGFAKLIYNIIIDPQGVLAASQKSALRKHNYPLQPITIDRQENEEKQFLEELKKCFNIWFYTLSINNLRETDFNTDRNDAVVANLKRLRGSMKNKGEKYPKFLHPDKNEIKKAISKKYKEYPILKLIKKEKNRVYQMKERLYQMKELLRNKKKKLLRDKKYKNLALKELNKKYKGKPALKAEALEALEKKIQKLNELERNIRVLEMKYSGLKQNIRIQKLGIGEFSYNELTEDEKEEMEECSDDILLDNESKIEEIINGIESRGKDEIYKLIMEKPPRPPVIIISFHGKGKDEFKKEFPGEYEEIKVNDIRAKAKKGRLSKGKGFKIPKEKFIGTLKETYNWCKKDEKENGEKWTGTKIAKRVQRLLKSRYGDEYDASFKLSYLENIISKIKQGKL